MTTTPTDPIVEMLINGVYVDVTADCRLDSADSGGGIEIQRGRPNEGPAAEPTQLNITLNNRSGKYSPENPNGPYFGQLGRNQRIRAGLARAIDSFNRTAQVDTWGLLPAKTTMNGDIIPAQAWHCTGTGTLFDTTGTGATIAGSVGYKLATLGTYADVDILSKMRVSVRDTEFGVVARIAPTYMTPPTGIADPTFEAGVSGWISNSGTVVQSTAQFHSGAASAQVTVTGAPATCNLLGAVTAQTMWSGITPGGNYRMRYWVRCSIATTIRMNASYYDPNLVFITSLINDVVVAANTWTLCEMTNVAPQDAFYVRPGPIIQGSPVAGTIMWLDDLEFYDLSALSWYTASIVPGGTDVLRINKTVPGTASSVTANLPVNILVNTDYWMRVQVTGQRIRAMFWIDGGTVPPDWQVAYFDDKTVSESAVPLTGEIGLFSNNGTGLTTFDSIQVDQWRAHAEITELPPRYDLSREDRWVPIQARGIRRRLGQGRKTLQSAVTLHLNSYSKLSYGWWPLEADTGDSAGNAVQGGLAATISGLTFNTPQLTGTLAFPGVSGYATLDQPTSSFVASIKTHASTGKETILFSYRLPGTPASDQLMCTIYSTGTVRTWRIYHNLANGVAVKGYDRNGALLVDQTTNLYPAADMFIGCWIVFTLYLNQVGGNIVWALNYHRPGNTTFYSNNSTVAGTVGVYTGIQFKSTAAYITAGGMSIGQIMHYAGDLPFVTNAFERASYAYIGELAAVRFLRLGVNAGIAVTTTGYFGTSTAMGAQLPNKLLDLLDECAEVEDGIVMEERGDWALCLRTRASMWNGRPHPLNIDLGHLSPPLEPNTDDQGTRNDVTVERDNGGFARSIQTSGPLNVNPPETDPDGVGTYDEQVSRNFALDNQLISLADARRSRGTLKEARYPAIHADLTAKAYQSSPALAASTMALDAGDIIDLTNIEVSPNPAEQIIQSYVETIDQFDWDITHTAIPARTARVGVVNYTTRIDTESHKTQVIFVSGTDTKLKSTFTAPGFLWTTLVDSEISFPFDVDVSGVRLRVTCTGDVLNSNPSFESPLNTTGWVATSANVSIAVDRFNPRRGLQSLRVQAVAAGTDGAVQDPAFSSVTVAATDYLISGWIKTEAAATDLRLAVDWYQADNTTFISTGLPTPIVTLANTWTWFSAVVTSPALAARGRLKTRNVFAGATRMWMDSCRIIPTASYLASPQTLTVEQVPVNGIIKSIPVNQPIRVTAPWRPAW